MLPDLDNLAGVLYGGAGTSQAPALDAAAPTADAARSDGELAAVLFDNVESNGYAPHLQDQLDRLGDHSLIESPEQRVEVLKTASEIFTDADIAPDESGRLFDLWADTTRNPPTDEQFDGWEVASNALLREFPDSAERLELARRYVNSRPALRDALNATGLGSHPQIVRMMLERAYSLGGKVEPGS